MDRHKLLVVRFLGFFNKMRKDVKLQQPRVILVFGSIIGTIILVYATALINRLLMGNYLMNNGLWDLNYVYLALLCAVPFVLVSFSKSTNRFPAILFAGVFFVVLFTTVHWAFVFYGVEMSSAVLTRTLYVLPISAILVVISAYIGCQMAADVRKEQDVLFEK